MDEIIQRKIDEILEMAKASESSDEKHVEPRRTVSDSLSKVIRNKKEAEEFMDNLNAAFERARRRKGL